MDNFRIYILASLLKGNSPADLTEKAAKLSLVKDLDRILQQPFRSPTPDEEVYYRRRGKPAKNQYLEFIGQGYFITKDTSKSWYDTRYIFYHEGKFLSNPSAKGTSLWEKFGLVVSHPFRNRYKSAAELLGLEGFDEELKFDPSFFYWILRGRIHAILEGTLKGDKRNAIKALNRLEQTPETEKLFRLLINELEPKRKWWRR